MERPYSTVWKVAKGRVTKDAWIDAAVDAIARGGVAAVAVDALAKDLGITRGSFYWHFADRDALLRAALEYWERKGTDDIIAALDAVADPKQRLLALLTAAVADDPVEGFEVSLAADAAHPVVAPVLARVTERRLAYLVSLFRAAGLDAATARRQAVTAYAVYVGWIHLRHTSSELVPELRSGTAANARTIAHVADTLLAGAEGQPRRHI